MKKLAILLALSWTGLWLTPDQRGTRRMERGDPRAAAEVFRDPMWKGVAHYRAGDFDEAAQAFAQRDTPEALFNQGNAWLFRGKYETAVSCYERALEQHPGWTEAEENRAIAAARAKVVERKGGDLGDQRLGADKVVFDKHKQPGGQDTQVDGTQAVSNAQMQALWLRRVSTRPADFLRNKFAYQEQFGKETSE